ncbi:hypothetical protein [Streptomyces thermoviolaceus]|uniref:hypothetical protein n=1 Tax=Streptomyces thermoviolaceus TaxID=1952 RepID=UPI00167373BE|nr:hypothetical protein [Streptomyces thermoviolaceus]GGV64809.1 hypothetical protein GCM10010499_08810 [Streptomyces thermoviolaceus subsp. apingens]
MTTTSHATQLQAAGAAVTVLSADPRVTGRVQRSIGPWWTAVRVPPESVEAGPVVEAVLDTDSYGDTAFAVTRSPHRRTTYAGTRILVADSSPDGVVLAVSPGDRLAYRSEPASGHLTVVGCEVETVATATARMAREAMRGVLLRDGWAVLHASAVALDGRVVLALGEKGAGRTTTALTLAARHGWELLADDRVFVRPDSTGGVTVLPWPSTAALGLGLLDALGWAETARERLKDGEAVHPTQHRRVTDALITGDFTPLRQKGKELKAQVYPDQFPRWFGVPLATGGKAAALVFPRIDPDATPAVTAVGRELSDLDFLSGPTENRSPDIFRLARVDGGGTAEARRVVVRRLSALPHHAVTLGHDITANAAFLAWLLHQSAS